MKSLKFKDLCSENLRFEDLFMYVFMYILIGYACDCTDLLIRGVPIHKSHGSVRTLVFKSRCGMVFGTAVYFFFFFQTI